MSFEKIFLVSSIIIVLFVVYFWFLSYLLEREKVKSFINDYKDFEYYILLNQFNDDIDFDYILFKLQEFNYNLYLLKRTKYNSLRKLLDKVKIIDFGVFYKI